MYVCMQEPFASQVASVAIATHLISVQYLIATENISS